MGGLLQKSMRRGEILTGYAFKFGGPINENNGLVLLVRLSLRCKRDQTKNTVGKYPSPTVVDAIMPTQVPFRTKVARVLTGDRLAAAATSLGFTSAKAMAWQCLFPRDSSQFTSSDWSSPHLESTLKDYPTFRSLCGITV